MEEFRIKQELGKYYIVVNSFVEEEENYLTSMITENTISGHIQCKKSFENGEIVFMYDVTNMISLEKEYENRYLEFSDLTKLFDSVSNIFSTGSVHLLEEKYYIIDPMYIFKDMETDEIKLLYVPGIKMKNRYSSLADFLLQKVNRKDTCCLQTAYQFYRMSGSEMFSISMFLNIVEKEQILLNKEPQIKEKEVVIDEGEYENDICETEGEKIRYPWIITGMTVVLLGTYIVAFRTTIYSVYAIVVVAFVAVIAIISWIKAIIQYWRRRKEDEILIPEIPVTVDQYWGKDEYEDNEETVILNRTFNSGMRIEWKENNRKREYEITSYPIIIGKLEGEVDCRIEDLSISRLHAKIVKREGEMFIFDLNSTNGTTVNGKRLRPGEEVKIDNDSQITLGQIKLSLVC